MEEGEAVRAVYKLSSLDKEPRHGDSDQECQ